MAYRFDDLVSAAKKRERKNSDHREQDYIRDLRPAKWGCEPKLHGSNFALPMSALGQGDISAVLIYVCFTPESGLS
jgi:hypothetical protein